MLDRKSPTPASDLLAIDDEINLTNDILAAAWQAAKYLDDMYITDEQGQPLLTLLGIIGRRLGGAFLLSCGNLAINSLFVSFPSGLP
jgi:hypothetical protein